MSEDPPAPTGAEDAAEGGGIWHSYRSMPLWLQIFIPVLVLAVVIAAVAAFASTGDEDAGTATTAAGEPALDDVLKGIIVVGGLTGTDTETTVAATPTATPEATSSEAPATTAEAVVSEAPTTSAAATSTAAPAPTSTLAAATTLAPTTTAARATTTEAPATTEEPATTEPTTTLPLSGGLPSVDDFFAQWNDAAAGTDVPTITPSQATELTGDFAGYYLVTLTPTSASSAPPQVGVLGQVTSPGSGQLAELLLVWIPGDDDEASSDFYWESFGVLAAAVSPGITADDVAALEDELGREPGMPPFTGTADATSDGIDYRLFARTVDSTAGPVDVSAIEVT